MGKLGTVLVLQVWGGSEMLKLFSSLKGGQKIHVVARVLKIAQRVVALLVMKQ